MFLVMIFEALLLLLRADNRPGNRYVLWRKLHACAIFCFMEVIMVALKPMTRQMCHEFYKGFQNDPAIGHYYEYIYTPEIADRYFDTNSV